MSSELDQSIKDLVDNLIPVVKRQILIALDRSREDVEFELVTPASLFAVRDGMEREL
jgi:hypothetical protein